VETLLAGRFLVEPLIILLASCAVLEYWLCHLWLSVLPSGFGFTPQHNLGRVSLFSLLIIWWFRTLFFFWNWHWQLRQFQLLPNTTWVELRFFFCCLSSRLVLYLNFGFFFHQHNLVLFLAWQWFNARGLFLFLFLCLLVAQQTA